MAIIGINSISGLLGSAYPTTEQHYLSAITTYVAEANQEIFQVGAFFNGSSSAGEELDVAVYDVTGLSAPYDNAVLVAQQIVTSTGASSSPIVELPSPVALVEGNSYAVCVRAQTACNTYRSGYIQNASPRSSVTSASDFVSPFVSNGYISREYAGYAETRTITGSLSVESDETNVTYGQSFTYTPDGFTNPITSWTLSDGTNTISLTGNDATNTVTIPALADGVNNCLTGSVTLTVDDGQGNTAESSPFTLGAGAGNAVVTLVGGFASGSDTWLKDFTSPAAGDQGIYPSANITLNSDGTWSSTTTGEYTVFLIDEATGAVQEQIFHGGYEATISVVPPAGYAVVELAEGFKDETDPVSILYGAGVGGNPPVVGTQIIYNTSEITVLDTGDFIMGAAGSTIIYIIDPSDGYMQSSTITTAEPESGSGVLISGDSTLAGVGKKIVKVSDLDIQQQPSTIDGTGSITTEGSATLLSGNSTLSGSGKKIIVGNGELTSESSTMSGAGEGITDGLGTLISQPSTMTGTGTVARKGQGSLTMISDTDFTGVGKVTVKGSGALVQSDDAVLNVTEDTTSYGSGVLVSGNSTLAGVAKRVHFISDATLEYGVSDISVTVEITKKGSGSLVSEPNTIDGTVIKTVDGDSALDSDDNRLNGAGTKTVKGSSILISNSSTLFGVAGGSSAGSGALVSGSNELSGTGQRGVRGSGSLVSQTSSIDGAGEKIVEIDVVNLTSNEASVNGSGKRIVKGTASLESGAATLSGASNRVVSGSGVLSSGTARLDGFNLDWHVTIPDTRTAYAGRTFAYILDPSDKTDFKIDFSRILGNDTLNTNVTVTLDEDSVANGVKFDQKFIPAVVPEGNAVVFRLEIDEAYQNLEIFKRNAYRVSFEVTVETTQARSYQRTSGLKVKQQ